MLVTVVATTTALSQAANRNSSNAEVKTRGVQIMFIRAAESEPVLLSRLLRPQACFLARFLASCEHPPSAVTHESRPRAAAVAAVPAVPVATAVAAVPQICPCAVGERD